MTEKKSKSENKRGGRRGPKSLIVNKIALDRVRDKGGGRGAG